MAEAKAKAAKAEATDSGVTFEYGKETYVIDSAAFTDVELIEAVEDEKYMKAIRGYLGAAQWARFKDSVRTSDGRVPMEEFEPFLKVLMEALGQGN